jgi:hypothetical protein
MLGVIAQPNVVSPKFWVNWRRFMQHRSVTCKAEAAAQRDRT